MIKDQKGSGQAATGADQSADPPKVDTPTLDLLGTRLRQNYQAIVDEGIPSTFLDLLEKLKTRDETTHRGEE